MSESFRVGTVLSTSLSQFARGIVLITLISALVHAPVVVWGYTVLTGEFDPRTIQIFFGAALFLAPITTIFATTGAARAIVTRLEGRPASFGASLGTVVTRFLPMLGVVLCLTVMAFAGTVLIGLIFGALPKTVGGLVGIAFWTLMYAVYLVAAPVAALERAGIAGALRRAALLTRGHRWRIVGLLVLVYGVQWAGYVALRYLAIPQLDTVLARVMLLVGFTVLYSGVVSAVVATSYYYLRLEKDGSSAVELAAVFE